MAAGKTLAFVSRVLLPIGALVTLCVFAYRSLGVVALVIGLIAAVFTVAYIWFIQRRYERERRRLPRAQEISAAPVFRNDA